MDQTRPRVQIQILRSETDQWRQYQQEPIVEAVIKVLSYQESIEPEEIVADWGGITVTVPARSVGIIDEEQLHGTEWPDNVEYVAESGAEDDDRTGDDPMTTDGGNPNETDETRPEQVMIAQPETCPECGVPVGADGQCVTLGCPGRDTDQEADTEGENS